MNAAVLSAKELVSSFDAQPYENISATDVEPEQEGKRRALLGLLNVFAKDKIVDETSARTASRFIYLLPAGRALPKVAPDGDGALTMLWDVGERVLLLLVDKRELLAITSPATPQASHLETAYIVGDTISSRILQLVPVR